MTISRGYRVVALMMLTLHLGGCYTWRPVPRAAGLELIEQQQANTVRLQRTDGTEVEARRPLARNDSIVWANGTERLSYADVRFIDVQSIDPLKSFGFGAAFTGVFLYGLLVLTCVASGECD